MLGIPQHYTEINKVLAYNGSTFKVRTSAGETKPINREGELFKDARIQFIGFLLESLN